MGGVQYQYVVVVIFEDLVLICCTEVDIKIEYSKWNETRLNVLKPLKTDFILSMLNLYKL